MCYNKVIPIRAEKNCENIKQSNRECMVGNRFAYIERASVNNVCKLIERGKTYDEVAEELCVSRATVWRRLREAGVLDV